MKTRAMIASFLLLFVLPLTAQQPRVENARLETRELAGSLQDTLQSLMREQTGPGWAGYAVPLLEGDYRSCCSQKNSPDCRCQLESHEGNYFSGRDQGSAKLEGPRHLLVLYRFEQGKFDRIAYFTDDCQLGAGGLPFTWFTGVTPAESISILGQFVGDYEKSRKTERRLSSAALGAIAQHADPAADRALETFIAPAHPGKIRKSAAFWLGAARGARGIEILRRVVPNDADAKFRKDAVFAFNVSEEPEALETMIQMARTDSSKSVRKQAIFWLGQKASKKAIDALTDAIENDPDSDIKKRAVFALSQLPKDEGIPLLIQVATTNKNPVVRKQAIFWLGQSEDPRALQFFEKILSQ